jgi:hypothetical protein
MSFEQVLHELLAMVRKGDLSSPSSGFLGELLATVLLSRAYDIAKDQTQHPWAALKASGSSSPMRLGDNAIEEELKKSYQSDEYFCTPISLLRFLGVFLSVKEKSDLAAACENDGRFADWNILKSSWLCFTSFCQTRGEIDERSLLAAFRRNVGIHAKLNNVAVDLAVSLVLPEDLSKKRAKREEEEEEDSSGEPSIQNISAVLVQVKNLNSRAMGSAGYNDAVEALFKSAKKTVGDKKLCVAILMQVGKKPTSSTTLESFAGSFRRIFWKENVLFIIKTAMEASVYPFMAQSSIDAINELQGIHLQWESVNEAYKSITHKDYPVDREAWDMFSFFE